MLASINNYCVFVVYASHVMCTYEQRFLWLDHRAFIGYMSDGGVRICIARRISKRNSFGHRRIGDLVKTTRHDNLIVRNIWKENAIDFGLPASSYVMFF